MAFSPHLNQSPILRTIGIIACIFNASAAICAFVMRARLFYLSRRARAHLFAEVCLFNLSTITRNTPQPEATTVC